MQSVEKGGLVSSSGVSLAAHPFLAALLRLRFPLRPIVVFTDQLKTQEIFHQDITTWVQNLEQGQEDLIRPLFFPSWEILPHESRLPHVDVISDRLETLVALSRAPIMQGRTSLIVASVTALLQRTFPRHKFEAQMRVLARGDRVEPLD